MRPVKYREGDWFAVPLSPDGFAVGVIARSNPKAALLGYFFGPRRSDVPSLDDVANLRAKGAVLVGKFGHTGLTHGKWPTIGHLEHWDRTEWAMPVFVRFEELTGRRFDVSYDDDDPGRLVREVESATGASADRPIDGLMGAAYVEQALSALLRR